MEAKGWDMVTNLEEGSSSPVSPIHESQSEVYNSDVAACSEEGNQYTYQDFSMDDRKAMYESFLESRDCLAGLGIDVTDAPTFQKFNDLEGDWTPFIDVPKGQLREVEKTCPQPFF
jgi:hypothetical protein